jgi:hypothetical protein
MALVVVAIAALVIAMVVQGNRVAALEARVRQLQAVTTRLNRQNGQLANGTIQWQQAWMKDVIRLQLDLAELKKDVAAPAPRHSP